MSVFPNKQRRGLWQYDFWVEGVRHRGYCVDDKGKPVDGKRAALRAEGLAYARAVETKATARRTARAGDYTLAQAQAALLQRVVDHKRKPEHIDNVRLWGDDVCAHFGPATPFSQLTQKDCDEYAKATRSATVKKWIGGARRPAPEDFGKAELWKDTGRPRSRRQANNYLKHFRKMLALAAKVKDPITRRPALEQDPPLELELERVPRRKPRPMPDAELAARLEVLPPWLRDVAELSRLFGLRAGECLRLELRHVDDDGRSLFFRGEESKSGHDEPAYGGDEGRKLLQRLRRQARQRGTTFLVTWPGFYKGKHWYRTWLAGGKLPAEAWQPLKTLGRSWRRSAKRAGVESAHRFHDVRARFITEVAKIDKSAAKGAARHQDPATTDLYIGVADDEVKRAVATAIARRPQPGARPGRARLRVIR